MTTPAQPAIPGLEPPAPTAGRLERVVFEALVGDRTDLPPLELARVELCLELARVMAIKRTSGRTSTYSNDAKLFAELLGFIGEDAGAGGGVDAELRAAIEAWNAVEERKAS